MDYAEHWAWMSTPLGTPPAGTPPGTPPATPRVDQPRHSVAVSKPTSKPLKRKLTFYSNGKVVEDYNQLRRELREFLFAHD